jgi:hypothetical protein
MDCENKPMEDRPIMTSGFYYSMGKKDGRKEVIEEIIKLLGLDDRYEFTVKEY